LIIKPSFLTGDPDVLIVGAGPTGLVLGLWLTRLGVRVRIVDKTAGPGTTSRAVAVQARTLELYRQIGLANAVVAAGRKMAALNLWAAGRQVAHAAFGDMGADISPFPYALIYPQDEHERLLIDRLAEAGVEVERETELVTFEEAGDRVLARIKRTDGATEACHAAYIAGCDGAHSTVRQALTIGFPGGTYDHLFYVADVEARGAAMNGELHGGLDAGDFLAVFPLKADGHARLIGTVRADAEHRQETLSWADVRTRVLEWMSIDVERVHWFSTYRVHHRVADPFQVGRAFLLGDAAHIHSPAGGQGMNTGIGDAINLAWKLKAVLAGQASDAILDTYETERRAFAQKLVATTDRGFTLATAEGRVAEFMRTRIVPIVVPTLFRFEASREFMYRAVSQISENYRDSALSKGDAGHVRGGDRLPWAPASGADNFDTFRIIGWQLHVYGTCSPDLLSWCTQHDLRLCVFPWNDGYETSGLTKDAIYLLRPDTYVALAAEQQDPQILGSYFAERGLSPASGTD